VLKKRVNPVSYDPDLFRRDRDHAQEFVLAERQTLRIKPDLPTVHGVERVDNREIVHPADDDLWLGASRSGENLFGELADLDARQSVAAASSPRASSQCP
jgi:hypothetical protein